MPHHVYFDNPGFKHYASSVLFQVILELSCNSVEDLVGSRLFRLQYFPYSISFGCILGVGVEV